MHDRNDDEKEESEYRFSDDDASYEAEHHEEVQASEPSSAPVTAGSNRSGMKRMAIGAVAVVALIAIVYKFVAPTSNPPSTEIVASSATQQSPMQADVPAVTPQASTTQPIAEPAAQAAAPQAVTPPAAQVATVPASLPMPGTLAQAASGAPVAAQPSAPMASSAASSLPAPSAPAGAMQAPEAMMPQATGGQLTAPSAAPEMMPMQSTVSAQNQMQGSATEFPQASAAVNAKIAGLEAQSTQLMAQLQEVYTQKLTDFSNQNKALQDQVQTLNTRVAGLETELKAMVQTLQQSQHSGQPTSQRESGEAVPTQQQAQMAEAPSTNYNVQAIIPGRAWLRAQNGETVTVAEGDVIRDLGRITKIDPYDGVVEINTGHKVISLSYGNAG